MKGKLRIAAILLSVALTPSPGYAAKSKVVISNSHHQVSSGRFEKIKAAFADGATEGEWRELGEFALADRDEHGQRAALMMARRSAAQDETAGALEWHLRANPDNFALADDIWLERADLLKGAARGEETLEIYSRIARSGKTAGARQRASFQRAMLLREMGRPEGPTELRAVAESDPDSEMGGTARLYLLLARNTPATQVQFVDEAIRALEVDPAMPQWRFNVIHGRLDDLRKSRKWSPAPAQSRQLFRIQQAMYRAEEHKKLLPMDGLYATAHLTAEEKNLSVLYRVAGQRAMRDKSGAALTMKRFLAASQGDKLTDAVRKELAYQRLRLAFSEDDLDNVAAFAKTYAAIKVEGGEPPMAYRLWAWSCRERNEPYAAVAADMLEQFPNAGETSQVYVDLLLDAYEAKRYSEGLRLADEYLDAHKNETWNAEAPFVFWRARHLIGLKRIEEATEALRSLDTFDSYGVMARELLATINGGKVEGYLSAPLPAVKPGTVITPESVWRSIDPLASRIPEDEFERRVERWQASPHYAGFLEAVAQQHSKWIAREGDALIDEFGGEDLGIMYLVASQARKANEHFYATVRLFRLARKAEDHGHPLRAPEFWRNVYPLAYHDIIARESAQRGLDPKLVHSLIMQESTYQIRSQSGVGAQGLMQLMPGTARKVAKDHGITGFSPDHVWEPEINIILGTAYLDTLHEDFSGRVPMMLAGYNAGPNKAREWARRFPQEDQVTFVERITYDETREYVKRILRNRFFYHQLYGQGPLESLFFLGQNVVIEPVHDQQGRDQRKEEHDRLVGVAAPKNPE